MPRKAVTIRDVAKRAGVGISTVSYVLNGHDQHVSANTREEILAVARELNYRPNAIARSMVKQSTATIGLIITELQNPLFAPIMEGLEEISRREGYHILLASADDAESEVNAVELMRGQQVDGFIFMSLSMRFPTEHLARLAADDVPFVVINRDLEPGLFNQIQFDDKGAGQHATQHLINLGHQRIGTICGPQKARRSAVTRHEGWQDALASQGLPIVQDWIVDGEYTYEGGYRAAQRLLPIIRRAQEPPTALFIANDMMAFGALWALQEAGIHIPQDLAIVTIGDPPFAAYTIPPLTTLALPVVKAGQIAARLLIDWLKYDKPAHNQHIVLDFDLKIRQSCGALLTL